MSSCALKLYYFYSKGKNLQKSSIHQWQMQTMTENRIMNTYLQAALVMADVCDFSVMLI